MSYESGWTVTFPQGLTRGNVVSVCEELAPQLSALHETPVTVEPERISNGGLVVKFTEHPAWYKTLRFGCGYAMVGGGKVSEWPFIPSGNALELWRDNDTPVFTSEDVTSTFLKAFDGAPVFTRAEMQLFEATFAARGGVVSKRGRKRLFAA